jgi:hypothetical protein
MAARSLMYANYDLEQVGLLAREGYVDGGHEGKYDLRVSYAGQRATPVGFGDHAIPRQWRTLGLSAGWVNAGSTSGVSAFTASLAAAVDIGDDPHRCHAGPLFFASSGVRQNRQ